jgi:hypothetical protein
VTASEAVWACIAVAVGLLVIATRGWDLWHKRRTRRRFQQAARTRGRVAADVAAWRALRDAEPAIDTEPGDPYSDDRITAELIFIPHQRTEDHR